jgi:SSS family transporter
MNRLDYAIMAAFILAICGLGGLFTTRRSRTSSANGESETDEHLLAGGRTPWWAAAISYVMALFSTVSLVATPGEAYNNGLRLYVLEWFAPFTGLFFFFIFVRFYFNVKTFTPFAYLERRFDARVRVLVSSIYLFTRISALAIILFSCARIFQGLAGWPVWVTALVVGAVSIIYSTLGGLKAVIWIHVLQFVVMVTGIGAVTALAIRSVRGGVPGIISYSFAHGKGFRFEEGFFSFNPHVRITFWALMMASIFGYMFYSSSDQIAIQQLLSTSSYKAARNSFITSTLIFIPLGAVLWFLGLAVFVYFSQHPLPSGNPSGDLALFRFIVLETPQPIPGLVAAAALSAATSTIGAMIMSLSTVATKDFYVRFFRPEAGDERQVAFSRFATVVLGILGTLMAIFMSLTADSLRETVVEANTIWGAIITVVPPVFLLGVISTRCNSNHVLGGVALGICLTIAMIAWYLKSRWEHNPISYLTVAMPAFIGSIVFGLVAPFFAGKRPSLEKLQNLTLFTLTPANHETTAPAQRPEAIAVQVTA